MEIGGAKKGIRGEINVTPLIDVVLVLLIIFMVMTPIMLKEMEVTVPQKADVSIATPVADEQLILRIDADGSLSINHRPVTVQALAGEVSKIFAGRREKVLFFDVDDRANYGVVVTIMDTCRGAGVKVLGIMTRS